ncbi:MAG: sugar phosphate isomerase/epimerase [Candidatus Liptonbacteria bacterium]|nr:sugar phosphate isomerase/epimerase [Candidatus Liptonbacteria bacterium]
MLADLTCDYTSSDGMTREMGINALKRQVNRAHALGAKVLGGPFQLPWNWRLNTSTTADFFRIVGERLKRSEESIRTVAEHAASAGITLFVEYLTRWEIAGINTISQALTFVRGINHPSVGILADSAHEILDGEGPGVFADSVKEAMEDQIPLHVHLSAPHRRGTSTSWLPWQLFLQPFVKNGYAGPYVVEIFDAKPPFFEGIKMTTPAFALPMEAAKSALRNVKNGLLAARRGGIAPDTH